MIKYLRIFPVILFVLLQTACNLSKYPIDDPPVVKIDTRLLGKWAEHKDKNTTYTMTRQNDYQYLVTIKERKKKEPETYTAYLSKVNDYRFLNVYTRKDTGS